MCEKYNIVLPQFCNLSEGGRKYIARYRVINLNETKRSISLTKSKYFSSFDPRLLTCETSKLSANRLFILYRNEIIFVFGTHYYFITILTILFCHLPYKLYLILFLSNIFTHKIYGFLYSFTGFSCILHLFLDHHHNLTLPY